LERLIVPAEPDGGCFVVFGAGEAPGSHAKLDNQIHVVENDANALPNLLDACDAISATPGLNVYVSVGLFKPREQWHNPDGRGAECDLIGTLAFVADFDRGHDPATYLDRLPLAPHAVVETSPGNRQAWLFLDRPYPAGEAKPLFEALTRSIGSDTTFSCEHVFRPPGTWNWPSRKKLAGGRPPEPQLARLVSANSEFVTLDKLRTATLAKYPNAFEQARGSTSDSFDGTLPRLRRASLSSPGISSAG
jgi:DNA primase RepB-like protein